MSEEESPPESGFSPEWPSEYPALFLVPQCLITEPRFSCCSTSSFARISLFVPSILKYALHFMDVIFHFFQFFRQQNASFVQQPYMVTDISSSSRRLCDAMIGVKSRFMISDAKCSSLPDVQPDPVRQNFRHISDIFVPAQTPRRSATCRFMPLENVDSFLVNSSQIRDHLRKRSISNCG